MRERLPGNLQQRLRELREEHGYKSMNKLADALEIDRTTYSRIEDEFDPTAKLAVLHVMLQKMHNRLHMLPEREQRILAYHYGLGELACRTISEAAAHFYFTEKYISEIEANALATLRDGMNDGKII